ncbi:hypothetical protein C2845_PM17G05150 [Panicum miliaceum]|uniref:Protein DETOXIFICATION n=1 Tax=Panicum miliaceum TaxID=4540 RepID=A0A3L6Q236_PANMI|nr:hypothetical protein C2845_PM17G05150 [Panicum miliaceum]
MPVSAGRVSGPPAFPGQPLLLAWDPLSPDIARSVLAINLLPPTPAQIDRARIVRVSNELGANRPKVAQFSVVVAASTSPFIGANFMAVFLVWRTSLPKFFSDDREEVIHGASRLGCGGRVRVASACGVHKCWQLLLGANSIRGPVWLQAKTRYTGGIWMGLLTGTSLQIAILLFIIVTMKWERQSMLAVERITEWGAKNNGRELMASIHINDQMGLASSEK